MDFQGFGWLSEKNWVQNGLSSQVGVAEFRAFPARPNSEGAWGFKAPPATAKAPSDTCRSSTMPGPGSPPAVSYNDNGLLLASC